MHQPGWYPSPYYPGQLQYWDGHGWTSHTKPSQPIAALPVSSAPSKPQKSSLRLMLRITAALLFLVALVPINISAPYIMHASGLSQSAEVVGEVVHIRYSTTTPNRKYGDDPALTRQTCSPAVTYEVNGTTYTARSNEYRESCEYSKGDSITIEYNEANPRVGTIKGQEGTIPGMWTFFTIGAMTILAVLALTVASFRVKTR